MEYKEKIKLIVLKKLQLKIPTLSLFQGCKNIKGAVLRIKKLV